MTAFLSCSEVPQPSTKLTRIFTRHSVILPASSVTTLMSLIHAPLMLLIVLAARFRPSLTASSMPLGDDELSSMTLAILMTFPPQDLHGCRSRLCGAVFFRHRQTMPELLPRQSSSGGSDRR